MRSLLGQGLGASSGLPLITLLSDGDSRTAIGGANPGDVQYPGQINSSLMPGTISTYHDVAVSGETLATMVANVATTQVANMNIGQINISSVWGGVNDRSDNLPNLYQQYFQACAAAPRSTRRVACTEISATNDATWETTRAALRTFINGTLSQLALVQGNSVISATNATPVVYTTLNPHGLTGTPTVAVAGVSGNAGANAYGTATILSSTTFSISGSVGSGASSPGGTFAVAGGAGVALIHAVADFGSNPQMGNAAANQNTTTLYHVDNLHPTVFGEILLAADYAVAAMQPWTAAKGMQITNTSLATAPRGTPTAFTLTGKGFSGATGVFLGGMAAASAYTSAGITTWSYTVVNDSTITGNTGVGIFAGTGDVVVVGPNGAVRLAGAFTYT